MYNWKKLLKDLSRDVFSYLLGIILMPLALFWVITCCGFGLFFAIYMSESLPTPIYWLAWLYLLVDVILIIIEVNNYLKKYKIKN